MTGLTIGAAALDGSDEGDDVNFIINPYRFATGSVGAEPTFIAAANSNLIGAAGVATVSRPTGTTTDDLMLAAGYHREGSGGFTVPAGWVQEIETPVDAGTTFLVVYSKTAGGSEPSSYDFGTSGDTNNAMSILTFRNPNGGTCSVDAFSTADGGDTGTASAHDTLDATATDAGPRAVMYPSACEFGRDYSTTSGTAVERVGSAGTGDRLAVYTDSHTGSTTVPGIGIEHTGGALHRSASATVAIKTD